MKQTRNIARQCFASILSAIVATLILKTIALGQVNPSWIPTGSLNIARVYHTATLLPNGKVLVTGGRGYNYEALNSAEVYGTGEELCETALLGEGVLRVDGGAGRGRGA